MNRRLLTKTDWLVEGVELLILCRVVKVPEKLIDHLLTLQAEAGIRRVRVPATCREAHNTLMALQGMILPGGPDDLVPYAARGQARRSVGISARSHESRIAHDPLARGWRWSFARRRWVTKA